MIHLFFHSPLLQQIYNAFNLQQSLSSVFKCLICCRVQLQFSLCRRFNSLPCVCPIACLLGWREPTAPDPSERGRGREANRRAETSQRRCPGKHLGALGDYLLCSHHSQQATVEQGFPLCQEQAPQPSAGWSRRAVPGPCCQHWHEASCSPQQGRRWGWFHQTSWVCSQAPRLALTLPRLLRQNLSPGAPTPALAAPDHSSSVPHHHPHSPRAAQCHCCNWQPPAYWGCWALPSHPTCAPSCGHFSAPSENTQHQPVCLQPAVGVIALCTGLVVWLFGTALQVRRALGVHLDVPFLGAVGIAMVLL